MKLGMQSIHLPAINTEHFSILFTLHKRLRQSKLHARLRKENNITVCSTNKTDSFLVMDLAAVILLLNMSIGHIVGTIFDFFLSLLF